DVPGVCQAALRPPLRDDAAHVPLHEPNGTALTRLDAAILAEPGRQLPTVRQVLPRALGRDGEPTLEANREHPKRLAKRAIHQDDSLCNSPSRVSSRLPQKRRMPATHAETSSTPVRSSS